MKKIGMYTARGIVTEDQTDAGLPQKIPLFDGSFKTAYRVIEFYIWGADLSTVSNNDVAGKLSKNAIGSTASASFFRADDDNQIAWAGSEGHQDTFKMGTSIVDPDNLIVEDLYVYAATQGTTSVPINYMIIMEKYEISDWQGALAMARDKAQGE